MDHSKALEKIKKCLRLAQSSNPNEAAAAMRQARALMEKYRIEESDVQASDVSESTVRSGSKVRPTAWENGLADTVAHAYCCSFFFVCGRGEYRFIGELAEVASYTLTLLLRQIRQSRRGYIADHLTRCRSATKTKRADLFCLAWVAEVRWQVMEFAGNDQPSAAVEAFMAKNYPELGQFTPRNRGERKRLGQRDYLDAHHGSRAARDVRLNHGVNGQAQSALH